MDLVTVTGVVGATIILVAFLLNQSGKLTAESRLYDALNFLGALLLLIYAYLLDSYPFMILNAVWMLSALRDLIKSIKKSS